MTRSTRRWGALAVVASLALAACGDDDGADVRTIGGHGSGSPSAPASGSPTGTGSGSGSPTGSGG